MTIDNNYKIKKGELNKIKHLEGLQYWEFCLIVIKCSNATTTTKKSTYIIHLSIFYSFPKKSELQYRRKKKETAYLKSQIFGHFRSSIRFRGENLTKHFIMNMKL